MTMLASPLDLSNLGTTVGSTTAVKTNNATDAQASQDRFLKLLVAQLNNQDPLNPMDNAQMTTQMAQINTVSGIQQLNETLKGLAAQASALQSMQGASLVGREIITAGNSLSVNDGTATGSFNLNEAADSVRVDVLGPAGELLGSVNLGARSAGMHNFDWALGNVDPAQVAGIQVTATAGGDSVAAIPLSRQRVESVGMVDGTLRMRTSGGQTVAYDQVLAFL
mgnify:CR=1 FL=1